MNLFSDAPLQLRLPGLCVESTESYQEGYNTGLNWDANWMPGGPWVYPKPTGYGVRQTELALHEQSLEKHVAWQDGFRVGLDERLKNDGRFRRWWKHNYGIRIDGRLLRYQPKETVQ